MAGILVLFSSRERLGGHLYAKIITCHLYIQHACNVYLYLVKILFFNGLVQVILNVCILVLLGLKCTRSLKRHIRHTRATFLLINHAHVTQWNDFETN